MRFYIGNKVAYFGPLKWLQGKIGTVSLFVRGGYLVDFGDNKLTVKNKHLERCKPRKKKGF